MTDEHAIDILLRRVKPTDEELSEMAQVAKDTLPRYAGILLGQAVIQLAIEQGKEGMERLSQNPALSAMYVHFGQLIASIMRSK